MNDLSPPNDVLLKRAYAALKGLRAELEAVRNGAGEPIAMIGCGCRFPGDCDNDLDFWRLLHNGVDAVSEVPSDRWNIDEWYDATPATSGKMYSRHGSFLKSIDQFDATFFGISPREAEGMDPQQRLLLEVTWEALENAAVVPEMAASLTTGMYVGMMSNDFFQVRLLSDSLHGEGNAYSASGGLPSIAAGRLSHVLGLKGPCMALDTSCSSSLVAVHLACQALRAGECDLAIAGGVNVVMSPFTNVALCKGRMLAPDGRCKTFDASADGYVRGEGCGLVVLKRLSLAQADGDRILAVIRGSAVNHDGRSAGLTVPYGPAQEAVIRRALAVAQTRPHEIDYLEAHGTGTSLGDPIEFRALTAIFGARRSDCPLWIGSVKTNLGHLESAAGIAGLLKTALALEQEEIPPHLHFQSPNPMITLDSIPADVCTRPTPWPRQNERPRLAGVSSFGFSGTNAHVVLAEAPLPKPCVNNDDRPLHLLAFSAKDSEALAALTDRYIEQLARGSERFADFCYTANTGRNHFRHRIALIAADSASARQQLVAWRSGELVQDVYHEEVTETDVKIAFLFPGQGSQYPGIGEQLYRALPTFRAALERCDQLLRPALSPSLLEVLYDPAHVALLFDPAYAQPILFSIQYALAELWRSWGILPSSMLGQGFGEYAAACSAGVFSLEDAAQFVGELAKQIRAQDNAQPSLIAGEIAGLRKLQAPSVSYVSAHAGGVVPRARLMTAEYWTESKESARTAEALDALQLRGCRLLIEMGAASENFPARDVHAPLRPALRAASLSRGDEWRRLLTTLAQCYVHGLKVDWQAYDHDFSRRKVRLPTYPFQRQRYWIEANLSTKANKQTHNDVAEFYDALVAEIPADFDEVYLTLAPFPRLIPGFSWYQTYFKPLEHLDHAQLALAGQKQMRRVLWRHVEIAQCKSVCDIGCGYGSDLIQLAKNHSHLDLNGFTISQRQAELTRRRVTTRGLQDRVHIYNIDSAHQSYPQQYDVVIALEVACYVEDKQALFANIANHLRTGGMLLLAEFVANTPSTIKDGPAECFIPTRDEWIEQLSEQRLRVVECVDASQETANFLYDDQLDLSDIPVLDVRHRHFVSYIETERILREQLCSYCLITVQKDPYTPLTRLSALNRKMLYEPTTYRSVIKEMEGTTDGDDWLMTLKWRQSNDVDTDESKTDESKADESNNSATTVAQTPGTWIIWSEENAFREIIGKQLVQAGQTCVFVEGGTQFEALPNPGRYRLRPCEADDWDALWRDLFIDHEMVADKVAGFVYVASAIQETTPSLTNLMQRAEEIAHPVLLAVQSLARSGEKVPAWLVTRSSQPVDSEEAGNLDLAAATLWGLGRTLALEHPELFSGLVDLSREASDEESASQLVHELLRRGGREQLAYRDGVRYVARLQRTTVSAPLSDPSQMIDPEGSYLITGGLGGLGLELAEWLLSRGAQHLLLLGRRAPSSEAAQRIDGWRKRGAEIEVCQADISRRDELADALKLKQRRAAPLRGVLHSAAVWRDGPLLQQTWASFREVYAPKIEGVWNLHELTQDEPLDFFVLFSSVSSLFGSLFQANYGAANSFLDALAHYRRARGLTALSINWGPWGEVGAAAQFQEARPRKTAFEFIPPQVGLEILERLLPSSIAQIGVIPINWSAYAGTFSKGTIPNLLDDVFVSSSSATVTPEIMNQHEELLKQLQLVPSSQHQQLIMAHLQAQTARVMGFKGGQLPNPRQPLNELGLDSLMALELKNNLTVALGRDISPTLMIDYPTIESLSAYLASELLTEPSKTESKLLEQAVSAGGEPLVS